MVPCINVYDLEGLARRLGAALLLVGDDAQLPPVSAAASGVLATEAMAKQFTSNDHTARLETVMRTGDGAVLQLSRAIRYSPDLRAVRPTESQYSEISPICLYQWENAWLSSACAAFNTGKWAADPDYARVLTWTPP